MKIERHGRSEAGVGEFVQGAVTKGPSAASGHMDRRMASINDQPIEESERLFRWPQGPRPADHPGLTELGL